MKKIILLNIAFFVLLTGPLSAQILHQEVEPKTSVKIESLDEITSQLEEKIKSEQPFDEKDVKVDVESLGLDDVLDEERVVEKAAENPAKIEKKVAKKENLKKLETPIVKESKSLKKKDGEKGILDKIKEFVVKEELKKPEEKIVVEKNIAKKDLEKLESEKNARKKKEEKMLRLNKLREKYLVKLNENKDLSGFGDVILPRKKSLDWSDRFTSHKLPAPPIMSTVRSQDNVHIPLIRGAKEKIDIMFSAISNRDVRAFNNAYRQIVNPDSFNQNGDTILTYAIILRQYPVIASVLNKGADPDLANRLGHSGLDIAIETQDLKAAQILIDMNVDINLSDDYNRTYLMHAVQIGYFPMVQLLVESGADIDAVDNQGENALSVAYRFKREIIAKYLLKNGAKIALKTPRKIIKRSIIKELENKWKKPTRFNSR